MLAQTTSSVDAGITTATQGTVEFHLMTPRNCNLDRLQWDKACPFLQKSPADAHSHQWSPEEPTRFFPPTAARKFMHHNTNDIWVKHISTLHVVCFWLTIIRYAWFCQITTFSISNHSYFITYILCFNSCIIYVYSLRIVCVSEIPSRLHHPLRKEIKEWF